MNTLEKLMEYRDAILLAEIGALIHDLGKLTEEFIREKSKEKSMKFDHEKILKNKYKKDIWFNSSVFDFLRSINPKIIKKLNIFYDFVTKNYHINNYIKLNYFGEFISKHGKPETRSGESLFFPYLFKFTADIIDSGVDKGAVSDKNKQSEKYVFISNPFGFEFEKINFANLNKYRKKTIETIEEVLKEIERLLNENNTITPFKWLKIRYKLLEVIKSLFIHGLGETRRPANDVTLWDHSYSTASLYKSALAYIILEKWEEVENIKWRFLSIRFNYFEYISKSVKIGDILGRKERLEIALKIVKNLLEVYLPLGNEIYRDENGVVFLIPDIQDLLDYVISERIEIKVKGDKIIIIDEKESENNVPDPDFTITLHESSTLKDSIYQVFNQITFGEIKPKVSISEESRGAIILGKVLKDTVFLNQVFINSIKNTWKQEKNTVKCCVCGLKPVMPDKIENEYFKICKECFKLRVKRAENWYNERINKKHTIWIDEVSDENKRVGVIVGMFDLSKWLNGMWLNTIFIKTLNDLENRRKNIYIKLKSWDELLKITEELFLKNNPKFELSIKNQKDGKHIKVSDFLEIIGGDSYHKSYSAFEYFEKIVIAREEKIIGELYGYDVLKNLLNKNNPEKVKSSLLILHLFRKNPSFARIRRIWETTDRFWGDIENKIKNIVGERARYKIILNKKIPNLKTNFAYEIRVKGYRIPVFYPNQNTENTELILIDVYKNIDLDLEKLEELLNKETFEIWIQSDYGKSSRPLFSKKDNDTNIKAKIKRDSSYYPVIPILSDPHKFVILVPLDKTWDVIKLIKEEYERQFSKVQNRLPLKLGIIAFKRKYPLYSVMDAVKRFLNEELSDIKYEVIQKEKIESKFYILKIKSKNSNRKIKLKINCSLGDPDETDEFYPYFVVLNHKIKNPEKIIKTLLYKDYIEKVELNDIYVNLKHISDLEQGDEIIFEPSIFDFEFLDSNIRRFDLGKKRRHWIFTDSENSPKPYLLWDIETFERLRTLVEELQLTNSQILKLYELLISKLEEWNMRKPPIELTNSKETKDLVKLFEKYIENLILSSPLRLKIDQENGNGKITKESFEFLKECIMTGIFFDFVDLWHTILKKDFGGDKNVQ